MIEPRNRTFSPWTGRVFLCAAAVLLLTAGSASAQKKLFAVIEPNRDKPVEEHIRFDTNFDLSDNIAPNITVTRDGKRGFVGYTGSGLVMAFSMETGEELARIQTGGKPTYGALLADGKTLAMVSVLDTRIFIIDTDTLALLASYHFPNSRFGFGSILALSPDGATGYISSTGSGEVIKFSTSNGSEQARLKNLEAPAQITVTPDGSTLLVVDTLKDELVFVDAGAMTRKSTLKSTNPLVNFTIFNRAVLSPDGTTGIIASRDRNGILAADTIIHFRTSSGEILDTSSTGSEPSYTAITPDGKFWLIMNEFNITVISTSDFKDGRFLGTPRGDALASANIIFSPDSRYAFYTSSSSDLVFQQDIETGAVVGQVLVGDNPNEGFDQPATLAMTPDGKVLAVVDVISNNIEFMDDVFILDTAKWVHSADLFTGLSILNLSGETAKLSLLLLDNIGQSVPGKEGEEIINPAEITLESNHQITKTVAELFNLTDTEEERSGWIFISSDRSGLVGYVSIGKTDLTDLDSTPMFRDTLAEWVIPEISFEEGKSVELNFVNRNYGQQEYDLARLARDGTVSETRVSNQAFAGQRQVQVFNDLFVPNQEDLDGGYLRIFSRAGLLFTEFFGADNHLGSLNGIDLRKFVGVKKVYFPQFAVVPGFQTILNLINAHEEEAEVKLRLYSAEGVEIGQPLIKMMAPGEQLKEDLAVLFKDDPEVQEVTGWLEIESTQERIVGTITFTEEGGRFLAAFELQGRPLERFVFPAAADTETFQTALALLNSGDEPAEVTLELWGPGGTLDRTRKFILPARTRTALYLGGYFENMGDFPSGNLRVISDRPLHGFALMNDPEFNFMTPLPPIKQAEPTSGGAKHP